MEHAQSSPRLVEVQLMASLSRYRPPDGKLQLAAADTITDVLKKLGIEAGVVQMAFVDGKFVEFNTPLKNAKRILLLPVVGGG